MSKQPGSSQSTHCRTIEFFQTALDQTYHNFLEAAKAEWQQLFADNETSDAYVSVHISREEMTNELAGVPRAGFIPEHRQSTNDKMQRWSP